MATFSDLKIALSTVEPTVGRNTSHLDVAFGLAVKLTAAAKARTVYFIGNGGSAGIASHMAADFMKNGGFKAMCFNDPALLTCLGNDLGYENVFSEPVRRFAQAGDLLFAISSSGRSSNIINAAMQANVSGMVVVTLSGFDRDNPLRKLGTINFYVPSHAYGVVEISHLAICHEILDRVNAG